jgi:hypothetical protein
MHAQMTTTPLIMITAALLCCSCDSRALPLEDGGQVDQLIRDDSMVFPDSLAKPQDAAATDDDRCWSNQDCPPSQFCYIEGACQVDGEAKGRCKPRPTVCDGWYGPVCGCDGNWHGNDCSANGAGVNVDPTGQSCKKQTCTEINKSYAYQVKLAKACCAECAALQCATKVKDQLACPCQTFVNLASPAMKNLEQQWLANGCDDEPWLCPGGCMAATSAYCDGAGSTGKCVDLSGT